MTDNKSYLCNIHKEIYSSYCNNCKTYICSKCINNHFNHKIILYNKIILSEGNINDKLIEFRNKIDKLKEDIEKIKLILNKFIDDLEIYYLINKNIQEKKTIIQDNNKDNNIMFEYMNKIISEEDINKKFNKILNFNNNLNEVILDKITLIYKISNYDENVQLFGKNFVTNNKNNCKIILNNKELDLEEEINIKESNINVGMLEIKLKGISNITDMSYMFDSNSNLISLPDISKINTKQIVNMSHLFCNCSNISPFPDIKNWDISNVVNFSIFKNI